jgi:hypothetical protein
MTDQVKAEVEKADEYAGADDLLQLEGVRTFVAVPVPKLSKKVRVRSLLAGERDLFEQSCLDQRGPNQRTNMAGARARLVSLTAVDGRGRLLYSPDDVDRLNRLDSAIVQKIWDAATALSGIGDKDIEELTRPFATTESTD